MRNYKDFQKNNFVYRENGVEIFLEKKGEFRQRASPSLLVNI